MNVDRQRPAARTPRAAGALLLAAPQWAWFGVAEFLRPWGSPTRYDAERTYDVVLDAPLYWISAGPGSLAVLLTAAGVARCLAGRRAGGGRRVHHLAVAAGALGVLSLVGVVAQFDPVATAGRLLGFLLLGSACALGALEARRRGGVGAEGPLLAGLACLITFLLPLWPLVYAVELVPPAGAALCFGVVGLGCVGLARASLTRPSHPHQAPGLGQYGSTLP